MSSSTLSAVIEKLIRSLCLNDFPGGNGTWRNTKGSVERAEMESTDALLDLLSCPHSPWRHDAMWSPQALPLRQLAVLTPERLHAPFIYNYFTSLRIVDRDVTAIDDGLLKFSKLEELVLSANKISEVPTVHLPRTLKILELRANRLSSLDSLTSGAPPPHLQYLGLGSNTLGSHNDVTHLTGRQWPQLVCLDLSNCGFQDQPALLNGLSTLPCLRTLLLEGNPFTLASSYPGLTVDSLPQLSCLDTSWISPEERIRFRGLAKMSGLAVGIASPTVSVGRMMGIPDPRMTVDDKAPVFPVKLDTETKSDTRSVTEGQRSNENGKKQTSKQDGGILNSEKPSCGNTCEVLRHSTSKLSWSESMDFGDTQTHTVSALGDLKKFLNRGLRLCLEEEKVLSWPAASEEVPLTKANQTGKEKKGRREKESPVKSDFTKSKDKNKKSVSELVQDAPIRRILGSVHIPLQSLVRGGQQVKVLCDFGMLHTDSEVEATQTHQKDLGRKIKDDKKEDKETKGRQHNAASSKDKEKKSLEVHDPITSQQEPVIVELIVELKKWQTASEAHHFLLPQTS
ncbi:leucine-rich repeat-containing protein 43 isoform X2 [Maylandia zebra]|uniref:leucine-rich repeat-containing protein 43 isoform X2 n=1 Tax=Maylandia zebra TaxID=106582 RepID=UPI00403D0A05